MKEPDTDAARLALAAIAEATGEEPLADRYREDQALRLPTARRVVETTYHATTLGRLMVAVNAIGAGTEVAATLRQLRQAFRDLEGRFGGSPPERP